MPTINPLPQLPRPPDKKRSVEPEHAFPTSEAILVPPSMQPHGRAADERLNSAALAPTEMQASEPHLTPYSDHRSLDNRIEEGVTREQMQAEVPIPGSLSKAENKDMLWPMPSAAIASALHPEPVSRSKAYPGEVPEDGISMHDAHDPFASTFPTSLIAPMEEQIEPEEWDSFQAPYSDQQQEPPLPGLPEGSMAGKLQEFFQR